MNTRPQRVCGRHGLHRQITVATADGTTQVLTVTMHGTNDAAVITGTSTAGLTETNAAQSTGGTLRPPTWTARTPSWCRPTWRAATATASSRSTPSGAWTYTMDTRPQRVRGRHGLHRQHHGGHGRRHRAGADGHHRRHQRCGGDHRRQHGGADRDQRRRSPPAARWRPRDVDSSNAFVAQTDVAGSNGYGKFSHRRGRRLDLHHELRPRRVCGAAQTTPTASRWPRPTAPTQVVTVTMPAPTMRR